MFVHKVLLGPQAGLYLPFALARLRALRTQQITGGIQSQKFNTGGYDIYVQYSPHYQLVRIIQSGGYYFEFQTSGKPVVTDTVVQETFSSEAYKAAVIGCNVVAKANVITPSPQVLLGSRFINTASSSAVGRGQHVQLINEPASLVSKSTAGTKKNASFPRLLYESYAPMHSHTGLLLRSFNQIQQGWGSDSSALRDIGFDVPWADTTGKKKPFRSAYLRGDADWPRASGIMTVTDATHGTREFAISVDAFSQFSVFPTGQIGLPDGINQNVSAAFVKMAKPTLPTWVYQMTGKFSAWTDTDDPTGIVNFPEIDWKLHPDGTKACAVVYARNPVAYDAGYFAGLPGAAGDPAGDFTDVVLPNTGEPLTLPGIQDQRYLVAPGMVEVTLHIALTGTNPEDFTFSVSVATLRDPTTSAYCPLVCGYTWYDINNPAGGNYATRGDLCVLDVEIYYDPVGPLSSSQLPVTATHSTQIMSLKNMTAGTEIKTFGGGLADYDMTSLSFAIKIASVTVINEVINRRPVPAYPPGFVYSSLVPSTKSFDFDILHPAVAIFTLNTLREVLYPDNIQGDQQAILAAQATNMDTGGLRAAVTGRTMFTLNDSSGWAAYPDVRNFIANADGYTNLTPTLTTAELNYFSVSTIGPGSGDLVYIATPQFGWYAYASAIALTLMKNASTTFFAHPNGTWAYFDATTLYNKNGSRFPLANYDTLTRFDPTKISQVIYDRVHFEMQSAPAQNTTFLALYNEALLKSTGVNALVDTFDPLTYADFRAVFSADTYSDTTNPNGLVITWSELIATWPDGTVTYQPDEWQQNGDFIAPPWNVSINPFTESLDFLGNGYFNFSTDIAWYAGAGYTGDLVTPNPSALFPPSFSSPILITG